MLDTKTNFVDEKVEIDPKDLQVSFGNNTTETKDKETNNDSKIVKVSLGNDSEALAEEKSKPKDKQDKNKIKQLEKSIKDREKEIKDQVKNNKKYKPSTNAWNGVIDYKNADEPILAALVVWWSDKDNSHPKTLYQPCTKLRNYSYLCQKYLCYDKEERPLQPPLQS